MNPISDKIDGRILAGVFILFAIIQKDFLGTFLPSLYQRVKRRFTMKTVVIILIVFIVWRQFSPQNKNKAIDVINFKTKYLDNPFFYFTIGAVILIYLSKGVEDHANKDDEDYF